MRSARILIADPSIIVRRVLADALALDPGIEVVGVAATGRLALEKARQLQPDLVIIDLNMPDEDGLAIVRALRDEKADLPLLFYCAADAAPLGVVAKARLMARTDHLGKPEGAAAMARDMAQIREAVSSRVRALCGLSPARPAAVPTPQASSVPTTNRTIRAVLIGASTGGPDALASLLYEMPGDFPVPIVVVQHMPPVFTRSLANRLNRHCALQVQEAHAGAELLPGSVWIAEGGRHLAVSRCRDRVRLVVHDEAPEHSCRPAVNVLFRSGAQVWGPDCLGLVLTGMGQDGLQGAQAIQDVGGEVLVQDEASSVVWGMPGFVARAGLAHAVLPLPDIAAAILARVENLRTRAVQRA